MAQALFLCQLGASLYMSSLLKATALVTLITLISRILGLVREMVMAWEYGMSPETDALSIAISIPYAFHSVIGISITAAYIPLMARYANRDDGAQNTIVSEFINFIIIISLLVIIFFVVFANGVVGFIGHGLGEDAKVLAKELSLLSFVSIIFLTLTGALTGILNYARKFYAAAIAPVILNVSIIGFVFYLSGELYVRSPIYGTIVGSFFGVMILFVSMRLAGIVYNPLTKPNLHRFSEMMSDVWPIVMISLLTYFYTVIDFRMGSSYGEGVITAFSYANRFMQLPQGIFVTAIAAVTFPKLSDLAARLDYRRFSELISGNIKLIFLLVMPAIIGILITIEDLTDLLFHHGEMDRESVKMISDVILILGIGLPGFCLNLPLTRAFYAFGDKLTPLYVAFASLFVKIITAHYFVSLFDYQGLAVSTVVALLFNAVVLFVLFNKKHCFFVSHDLFIYATKSVASVLGMYLAYLVFDLAFEKYVISWGLGRAGGLLIDCFVCLVAYYLLAKKFGLLKKLI